MQLLSLIVLNNAFSMWNLLSSTKPAFELLIPILSLDLGILDSQ
jgi:hypothetical protein